MLILDLDGSLVRSDDTLLGRPLTVQATRRRATLSIGSILLAQLRTYVTTFVGGTQR